MSVEKVDKEDACPNLYLNLPVTAISNSFS